jgi:hypothetical protein
VTPPLSPSSTITPPAVSIRAASPGPPTATPTLAPEAWMEMAVIPVVSERAIAIYRQGVGRGNNQHAFSKIGDGEVASTWFLGDFDLSPQFYDLGPHQELTSVIGYFSGSYGRRSQAARAGFSTSRMLDPNYADPAFCLRGETPLDCELRLHRPSLAFISLGTNQVWTPERFAVELRQIIEILLAQGVVPILSTKGDNLEGDYRINATVARLAYEYDIPLWNFWRAIQPLPGHGLQPDKEHLTWAENDFGDSAVMQSAWPVRNLTALQVLDAIRERVQQ